VVVLVVVVAVAGYGVVAAAVPGIAAAGRHMPACHIWPGGQVCASAALDIAIPMVPAIANPINPFRIDTSPFERAG
jgi:hypothetical protein